MNVCADLRILINLLMEISFKKGFADTFSLVQTTRLTGYQGNQGNQGTRVTKYQGYQAT